MYDVKLNLSHFPAQYDVEVCDITVGDLLRETAASHPDAIAMVDIADNGDCGQSWTYGVRFVLAARHRSTTGHNHRCLRYPPSQ